MAACGDAFGRHAEWRLPLASRGERPENRPACDVSSVQVEETLPPKPFLHNPSLPHLFLNEGVFTGVRYRGPQAAATLVTSRLDEMMGSRVQAFLLLNLETPVKT